MEANIYYRRVNLENGPITAEQLRELMQDQVFQNEALVKMPGSDQWRKAITLTAYEIGLAATKTATGAIQEEASVLLNQSDTILRNAEKHHPQLVYYLKLARVLALICCIIAVIFETGLCLFSLGMILSTPPYEQVAGIPLLFSCVISVLCTLLLYALVMVFLEYVIFRIDAEEKRRHQSS